MWKDVYGRQNPISERWNSDEQLVAWRAAWAYHVNLCLEQAGHIERIDHRSFADQGKDEQPTIHEGVAARTMEKKGIVSDRCELNRQIRRDNALLRQLKTEIQNLITSMQNPVLALAQAMEKLRANMIVMAYQVIHTGNFIKKARLDMTSVVPIFRRYSVVTAQIKAALSDRKTMLAEKKNLSPFHFPEHRRINARIAELTEELEELKSEKESLMLSLGKHDDAEMKDVKIWINSSEKEIQKAEAVEAQYTAELETALAEYHELEARAVELDPNELDAACCSIRPEEEKQAALTLKSRHGNSYDPVIMQRAKDKAANLLSKESVQTRVRFNDSQKDKLENERRRRSTHKKKAEERER